MNKLLKHNRFFISLPVILLLLFVTLPISIAHAAQLFEHYNEGTYSSGALIQDTRWVAQTFTAESSHSVTLIRLPISRDGDPGNVTVSIQGTDWSGHPDGTELASKTIPDSEVPTWTGPWMEISFTTPCDLTEGQKYAIVVRAPFGSYDENRIIVWSYGNGYGSGAYDGGNTEGSSNSGSTWSTNANSDLQFEIYGEEPSPVPTLSQWGMIGMTVLFAGGLVWAMRKRRQTSAAR